ncbi:PREDICTED: odorant receptor 49b-like [Trachymyrmex septentrionalis]|uniref:odorant receptor 49b-like n=1 Tax=Trachymyrmex septentrionalis TaxID=34720 RepID=UPI00084F1CBC|nr:PREDICTED: odorant receptor 49b-like [Trachymyrmex septentrionalis]
MFISLTGVFTVSLCFSFLRIFQIASSGEAVREIFLPVIFIFANIMYLFICNFFGQNIIDHNSQVFITAYSVQWYIAPLHIQRMILFLLLKGAKDFTIIVGGIFVSSIECFATLIKASISYFTVVLSMQ